MSLFRESAFTGCSRLISSCYAIHAIGRLQIHMYAPVGRPQELNGFRARTHTSSPPEQVQTIINNSVRGVTIVLTNLNFQLWSTEQQCVKLVSQKLPRVTAKAGVQGLSYGAVWHPSETLFAVLYGSARLRVYKFEYRNEEEFLFPSWFGPVANSLETSTCVQTKCMFYQNLGEICSCDGVVSLNRFGATDVAVLSSNKIVLMSWDLSVKKVIEIFSPAKLMFRCRSLGIIGFHTVTGNVCVFSSKRGGELEEMRNKDKFTFVRKNFDVSVCTLNRVTKRVAVGTETGNIHVYVFTPSKVEPWVKSTLISSIDVKLTRSTGKGGGLVFAVEWSPNGTVLASWSAPRGLTIWTPTGCCVFACASFLASVQVNGIYRSGVLQWVNKGSTMMVGANQYQEGGPKLMMLPFLRSSRYLDASALSHKKLALVESGCIYFCRNLRGDSCIFTSWAKAKLPMYCGNGLAIVSVSACPSKRSFAVVGGNGTFVYNISTKVWHHFGAQLRQGSMIPKHLVWVDDDVFACANGNFVSFWSRTQRDRNTTMQTFPIDNRASVSHLMRVDESMLAIVLQYGTDFVLHPLVMSLGYTSSTATINVASTMKLENIEAAVSSKLIFVRSRQQEDRLKGKVFNRIVLHNNGILSTSGVTALDAFQGLVDSIWIQSYGEHEVVCLHSKNAGLLCFTVCGTNLRSVAQYQDQRLPAFNISDWSPFGFMTSRPHVHAVQSHTLIDCQTDPMPLLPHVILQFLKANSSVMASHLLSANAREDVAESLLFLAVEDSYKMLKCKEGKPSNVLPCVLSWLKCYPASYVKVVGRCARIVERSRWPLLFPLAGAPVALFSTALRYGMHTVASGFLVIIAERSEYLDFLKVSWGNESIGYVRSTMELIKSLLEHFVVKNDVGLKNQLQRFVRKLQLQLYEEERLELFA